MQRFGKYQLGRTGSCPATELRQRLTRRSSLKDNKRLKPGHTHRGIRPIPTGSAVYLAVQVGCMGPLFRHPSPATGLPAAHHKIQVELMPFEPPTGLDQLVKTCRVLSAAIIEIVATDAEHQDDSDSLSMLSGSNNDR